MATTAAVNAGPAKALAYLAIFRASPADRIAMIREGVPAMRAKRMIQDLRLDQRSVFEALNLKTATVNRKAARDENLAADESERVLGVAGLVGQLEAIIEESGELAGFDCAAWLSRWLNEPLPALGGVAPITMLDTMVGQTLVADALARIQSGAYA